VEHTRQLKSFSSRLPSSEAYGFLKAGRRTVSVTGRLCGLYVMVTMNMDLSLIRYYLESGEFKKWFKQCLNNGQCHVDLVESCSSNEIMKENE
jgi:hypothetical protein